VITLARTALLIRSLVLIANLKVSGPSMQSIRNAIVIAGTTTMVLVKYVNLVIYFAMLVLIKPQSAPIANLAQAES
jgi:hypothetical protein